jgi:hypothetical protein
MRAPTADRRADAARRSLPFTLYVLAGLMLVKAVALLALVAGATVDEVRPLLGLSTIPELLVSVIGMIARRRFGWLVGMVITGLFVAADIYAFANGTANHVWMALNIVTVFYLNQQDVREVVGAAGTPDAGVGQATP